MTGQVASSHGPGIKLPEKDRTELSAADVLNLHAYRLAAPSLQGPGHHPGLRQNEASSGLRS